MEKKRLERDDRINLQAGMAKGLSLAQIARILRKARSTVFREIVNNRTCPEFRFQFGFLITKQSASSVLRKVRKLQKLLGERYWGIFQVNLSDDGVEFGRFHEIEGPAGGDSRLLYYFVRRAGPLC